jgi:hypothetical protein
MRWGYVVGQNVSWTWTVWLLLTVCVGSIAWAIVAPVPGGKRASRRTKAAGMKRRICYIIGAGLTKSLEVSREFRVPLMTDFVAVLADHIEDDVVLTALTNFEKGGVFGWSRPEWLAIADALKNSSSRAAREKYAEILRRRPAENIEDLLRRAVRKKKGDLYAALVEQRFGFAVNAVFAKIGWQLRLDVLAAYLGRQFALPNTSHAFISYNYDLVLDTCIQRAAGGAWSPVTGYGIQFPETIQVTEAIEHMKQFTEGGGAAFSLLDPHPAAAPARLGDIVLLKPHGSLNWLVPFEDNYRFTNDPPLLLLDGEGRIAYCKEFAVMHISDTRRPREIAFDAGLFITPPLDEDSAPQIPSFLKSVQERSLEALAEADEMVVIGWSMATTDKVEVRNVSAALSKRQNSRRLTAVNFNGELLYFQDLARVCSVPEGDVLAFNAGFVDFATTR